MFLCTHCGACCTLIHENWIGYEKFKEKGWILPDSVCANYDAATKSCRIYEQRPDVCRLNTEKRLLGWDIPDELWLLHVEQCCEESHMRVYDVPRERSGSCNHRVKGS